MSESSYIASLQIANLSLVQRINLHLMHWALRRLRIHNVAKVPPLTVQLPHSISIDIPTFVEGEFLECLLVPMPNTGSALTYMQLW